MAHILIIEDESAIADTLVYALEAAGMTTTWFNLAKPAMAFVATHACDAIVLDVGLPDMNGFEVCKQLRILTDVPILFLTARSSEIDRIVGLEIGADDYVVKPFSPREVATRVKVILKRVAPQSTADPALGMQGDPPAASEPFVVDQQRVQISYHQTPLTLTKHEFLLLQTLIAQPRRVFTRENLLDAIGISSEAGYTRAIDSLIKGIRAKLRQIAPDADPIQTQRGFGYRYEP